MSENTADIQKEIAKNIKYVRLLHEMDSKAFADILGCNKERIERIEAASEPINAAELFLIASDLLIPIEKLFPNHQNEDIFAEEELPHEAYVILRLFSDIEDADIRRKVLGMCRLYNELHQKPILGNKAAKTKNGVTNNASKNGY